MQAFNKRFRPTLHFGAFTLLTLAMALLGLLLLVFAVGAFVQIGNPPLGVVFVAASLGAFAVAVRDHLDLPKHRLKASIFRGKRDRRKQRLELHG